MTVSPAQGSESGEIPSPQEIIVRGTPWLISARFLGMVLGLISTGLLARLLSPRELGAWFLVLSLVSTAVILVQFGTPPVLVRKLSTAVGLNSHERSAHIVRSAMFWITVLGGLMAALLAWLPGRWLARTVFGEELLLAALPLAGMLTLVMALEEVLGEVYRGLQDLRTASMLSGVTSRFIFVCVLAGWAVASVPTDLPTVVLLLTLSTIPILSLSWGWIRRQKRTSVRSIVQTGRDLMSASWAFLLNRLLVDVIAHADLWIVGIFLAEREVGTYGAALRLVLVVEVPLVVVNQLVLPLVGRLTSAGQSELLQKVARGLAGIAIIPTALVAMSYLIGGRWILEALFGAPYADAYWVLAVLSVASVVHVYFGPCGITLAQMGHERSVLAITSAASVLAVVAAVSTVDSFGSVAVAASSAGGLVLKNTMIWRVATKRTGVSTLVDLSATVWLARSLMQTPRGNESE